ncbi:MAG: hypothetical protein ACK518_00615 [bacterium]
MVDAGYSAKRDPRKKAHHVYCERDETGDLTKHALRTMKQHLSDVEVNYFIGLNMGEINLYLR